MTTIELLCETSEARWTIWPKRDAIPAGQVQENRSYLFELHGSPEAGATDLLIDEVPLEALRTRGPGSAKWRWDTGFHAGEIQVELRRPGQPPVRFELVTDPDRNKLTRAEFDVMIAEILQDSFALFSLTSFRKGIAHGVHGKPPAIARLEYLRSRIEALESVVAEIARRPRRMLRAEDQVVPYYRAHRATGSEILRSFARGRVGRETTGHERLPNPLRGYLPAKIWLTERRSSLDIPEHRQIGAVLVAWAQWLHAAAERLDRARSPDDPERLQGAELWAHRCRRLSRRLWRMREAVPFAESGQAPPRLHLSALFRNDPAYRRFYRLYQEFNLGLAAIFGDFLNLPLARTYELYELWCFLRLVRAGVAEFGSSAVELRDLFLRDSAGGVTLSASAVTVTLSADWQLMFQRRYEEFWKASDGRGSFSRNMTPDLVLARLQPSVTGPCNLIVLDAKYRIDTGLNDAISSIHTYRDALVEEAGSGALTGIVRAAYLITPHTPSVAPTYRGTPMPGRLFHPDYRTTFRFGAATLRPGMDLAEVVAALKVIIADAGLPVSSTSSAGP